VCRRLPINGTLQIEHADDAGRAKVELLAHNVAELLIRELARAEGIDRDRGRRSDTDRIGELNLHIVREARCNQVLCDIARRIGCGAVHLGRILAGERAAAVARIAAVGIDNNLSAGQARIAVRTADYKAAGRVNIKARVLVHEFLREHRIENILLHIRVNLLLTHLRIVLGREDHRVETRRLAVLIVLDRNLALAVRAKIRERLVLSELGQLAAELVCKADRIGHELRRLAAGIAEHEALVAGTLIEFLVLLSLSRLECMVHTLRNVGRLLMQRGQHRAGVAIKAVLASRVTDFAHRVAHQLLVIDARRRGNLTHQNHQTGCGGSFARDTALRILC